MIREEALKLINEHVKTRNLRKHMIAAEVCMRALAARLGENEDEWAMAGLLHDLDYDQTVNDFERHGILTKEILQTYDVSPAMLDAIIAHAGKKTISSKMELALYAVDPLTGLIVAAALMHPTKKIANVDTGFVMNRFKEKRFAAGADRDQIRRGEGLGLSLEEFVGICLGAMQGAAGELGL
ncbi:MAG: HDIG domain-containing protein [Candidatus Abyssobacteria bacterium SURF_17]|uniref:HDIG domain-containing protein n=1 Tax=Candidatus Abyssobacteria bacterium SURF_17 TaxID=2093361 RepID=A0A419F2R9_9BACT|nr:MAG: HDIG domain-containing protein [Candidatus Abyssubacteria bacterium SURF_17]